MVYNPYFPKICVVQDLKEKEDNFVAEALKKSHC